MADPNQSPWARYRARSWKASIPAFSYVDESQPAQPLLNDKGEPVLDPATKQPILVPVMVTPEYIFRETGSAAALVDIIFGQVTGEQKEQALATLVVTSLIEPTITLEDFNSLGLQHKASLFGEVFRHVEEHLSPGFRTGSGNGAKTTAPLTSEPGPKTENGGSGEPPSASDSETPAPLKRISVSAGPSRP